MKSKVRAQVTDEWQEPKAIAALAGVEDRQANLRLRRMRRDGEVEHRRLIQYRLVPKKKADK